MGRKKIAIPQYVINSFQFISYNKIHIIQLINKIQKLYNREIKMIDEEYYLTGTFKKSKLIKGKRCAVCYENINYDSANITICSCLPSRTEFCKDCINTQLLNIISNIDETT